MGNVAPIPPALDINHPLYKNWIIQQRQFNTAGIRKVLMASYKSTYSNSTTETGFLNNMNYTTFEGCSVNTVDSNIFKLAFPKNYLRANSVIRQLIWGNALNGALAGGQRILTITNYEPAVSPLTSAFTFTMPISRSINWKIEILSTIGNPSGGNITAYTNDICWYYETITSTSAQILWNHSRISLATGVFITYNTFQFDIADTASTAYVNGYTVDVLI